MRQLVGRWPVVAFFLLALGISWAGWIPYAASQTGRLGPSVPAELIWAAEYGPTIAAIVLTWWLAGMPAVRALLAGLVRWRVPTRWYLLAIFLTPVLAAAVAFAMPLLGRGNPDPALLGSWAERFTARTAAFSPSMGLISGLVDVMRGSEVRTFLVFTMLAITNGGISEEVGWRGYAQPKLQARYHGIVASVIVGVLWGLWHTGTGFWQMMLTAEVGAALAFAGTYLVQYLVLVIPLTVVYAVVRNGSGGSLLLCVLLHASYNMTITVVSSAWPTFPLAWFVGLLWIVAIGFAVVFRSTLLARRPEGA